MLQHRKTHLAKEKGIAKQNKFDGARIPQRSWLPASRASPSVPERYWPNDIVYSILLVSPQGSDYIFTCFHKCRALLGLIVRLIPQSLHLQSSFILRKAWLGIFLFLRFPPNSPGLKYYICLATFISMMLLSLFTLTAKFLSSLTIVLPGISHKGSNLSKCMLYILV